MKHTPGPWKIEIIDNTEFSIEPMNYLLIVSGAREEGFTEEEEANAKLIAAAPEQHQALLDVEKEIQMLLKIPMPDEIYSQVALNAKDVIDGIVKPAIAKATE